MHINLTSLPVSLQLDRAEELPSLLINKSLRELPGKRLVGQGIWQDKSVVAKLFLDPRNATRHWKREKKGIHALQKAGIRTPDLQYSGQLKNQTPVLIFELLPEAVTALDIWKKSTNDTQRLSFLQQLLSELANHHRAGLLQKDLHLNNFLYSKHHWYTIDADTIDCRQEETFLDFKTCLDNLALFFAQLSPEFDYLVEPALAEYAQQCQLDLTKTLNSLIVVLAKKRKQRRHKYIKKSYRTCSEFIRHDSRRRVVIYRRDTDPERIQQLLNAPDALIAEGKTLKDGNSATVAQIHHPQVNWVIKRYNIKNFWHGLRRCLRPSRAWISWGNAHRLTISGIATPKAIAVIENRFGPIRLGAYYICEHVSAPDAAKYFHDIPSTQYIEDKATQNFITLFTLLHNAGIHHGDCKATNFLISNQQPWVIDLDAMREFRIWKNFSRHYHIDRKRFLRNWEEQSKLWQWFNKKLPE